MRVEFVILSVLSFEFYVFVVLQAVSAALGTFFSHSVKSRFILRMRKNLCIAEKYFGK